MSIGLRIREARETANISQAELARRVDMSKGHLGEIENQDYIAIGAQKLFAISQVFGVSIVYLITGQHEPIPIENRPISPELERFARNNNLAPHEVKMLANINYRGQYIQTEKDYWFIFESIKRSVWR